MASAKWAHIPGHGGYKGHPVRIRSRHSPGDLPRVRAQRLKMKNLLLPFLLLGLVAVLKAQEVPVDDQDFSGTWYTKAIMHNDSLPGDKVPMQVYPMKVTALEGGNLETKITFCRKTMYIQELPVKDHYIFYCEGQHHGKYFSIGKLVGRDTKENPEAMEEFKKFTQLKGLQEKNIFVPEMSGESRTAHTSVCVPYVTAN
ncbi:hypothetical protein A6R68_20393, partial [Neotoma lepida]